MRFYDELVVGHEYYVGGTIDISRVIGGVYGGEKLWSVNAKLEVTGAQSVRILIEDQRLSRVRGGKYKEGIGFVPPKIEIEKEYQFKTIHRWWLDEGGREHKLVGWLECGTRVEIKGAGLVKGEPWE